MAAKIAQIEVQEFKDQKQRDWAKSQGYGESTANIKLEEANKRKILSCYLDAIFLEFLRICDPSKVADSEVSARTKKSLKTLLNETLTPEVVANFRIHMDTAKQLIQQNAPLNRIADSARRKSVSQFLAAMHSPLTPTRAPSGALGQLNS